MTLGNINDMIYKNNNNNEDKLKEIIKFQEEVKEIKLNQFKNIEHEFSPFNQNLPLEKWKTLSQYEKQEFLKRKRLYRENYIKEINDTIKDDNQKKEIIKDFNFYKNKIKTDKGFVNIPSIPRNRNNNNIKKSNRNSNNNNGNSNRNRNKNLNNNFNVNNRNNRNNNNNFNRKKINNNRNNNSNFNNNRNNNNNNFNNINRRNINNDL